jgi:hypothetical protein
MRIISKDKWGFWIFVRYSFIVEDQNDSITEIVVDKSRWEKYTIGDYI